MQRAAQPVENPFNNFEFSVPIVTLGMRITNVTRIIVIALVLISNIGCDQVSKSIVRKSIGDEERIRFLDNHFTLMKTENTGAFLSLGHELPRPLKEILLIFLPTFVLMMVSIYLLRKKDLSLVTTVAIGFILGGGIGNLYDRIVLGSVTDFMHIDFGIFQTGVFNMADVSIMTGAFLLITFLRRERGNPQLRQS
jgi:signal peptidase II